MPGKGNVSSEAEEYPGCAVAICIMVIITVISIGIISNVASGQTSQVSAQEPSHTLSAGLVSDDAIITTPKTVFPSHVYVLNNSEIVTERPVSKINRLCDTVEVPSSHQETTSHSATIRASVTAASSRLIVVDGNDTIIEIWSNTTGTKRRFYSLRVKEQSRQGQEHSLTQGILAQYNRLLGEVDWSINGRVY